jgi:hypothetical protein
MIAMHLREVEENWCSPQRSLQVYVHKCNRDVHQANKWVAITLFREEGYFLDEENCDDKHPMGYWVVVH